MFLGFVVWRFDLNVFGLGYDCLFFIGFVVFVLFFDKELC